VERLKEEEEKEAFNKKFLQPLSSYTKALVMNVMALVIVLLTATAQ
jgi:hypothetical protein